MAKHILIAEDNAKDADALCLVLRSVGVTNPVTIARDGEEALKYLKGEGSFADREKYPLPSVLLLDLKLPRLDGLELLTWMTSQPHLASMLIITISGLGSRSEIAQSYQLGSRTFLTKPVRLEDMGNLVRSFPGYWAGIGICHALHLATQLSTG